MGGNTSLSLASCKREVPCQHCYNSTNKQFTRDFSLSKVTDTII